MTTILWLVVFGFAAAFVEIVADDVLGITPCLRQLPGWKVRVHETLYFVIGIVFARLFF